MRRAAAVLWQAKSESFFTVASRILWFKGPRGGVLLLHGVPRYDGGVPSRYEVVVGAIVALGVLAVVVAFEATRPPWLLR
jgi:hypothetical protein